ncbi:hypothetical protein ACFW6S_23640 [Streptomyces sp. NPDC058740]|uniref:hypothetical protein n=1 Tax=unclassified Streptomyces TaxID=2593676 RepID=UPI0036979E40
MRLRSTLIASASALLLALTVTNPAQAATGDFNYTYIGSGGISVSGQLADPESGVCINIPETVGNNFPAIAPRNFTGSTATVFLDADCDGDTYYVMSPGKILGDRLRLRSVVFS